jgi:hypothetical protein
MPYFSLNNFLLDLALNFDLLLFSPLSLFIWFLTLLFFSSFIFIFSTPRRSRNLLLFYLFNWLRTMMCSTARLSFSIGSLACLLNFLKSQIGTPYYSTCFSAFITHSLSPSISSYFSRKKSLSSVSTLTLTFAIAVNKNPSLNRIEYMPITSP